VFIPYFSSNPPHKILHIMKFIETEYKAEPYVEQLERRGLQSDTILISGLYVDVDNKNIIKYKATSWSDKLIPDNLKRHLLFHQGPLVAKDARKKINTTTHAHKKAQSNEKRKSQTLLKLAKNTIHYWNYSRIRSLSCSVFPFFCW